ncbi:dipeptidase [Nibrella saemangeumensis]|uniref:Dipeptidase n=1 Tax=Nibrella saemangeumensis TaxID=1084526 RepID=A0ABP8MZG7_9BACT
MTNFFFWTLLLTALVPGDDDRLLTKARRLHQRMLSVDTHADAPINMVRPGFNMGAAHDTFTDESQIDFPRMKQGSMDAMFFAVYTAQGPRTPKGHQQAKEKAFDIYKSVYRALQQYPDMAELATTPDDAYRLKKAGKRAIFIGMENGYPIGKDLSLVKAFYELGCRYITLAHFANNEICDSATDPDGPLHNGLSAFGREVVKEMNRLGILVDVSHVSDSAFYDILHLSRAPVIASHSNARALCDMPRNMTDDMIKAIAANGGVVQVNFVPEYLRKPSEIHRQAIAKIRMSTVGKVMNAAMERRINAQIDSVNNHFAREQPTVADVARHIDYIAKLVGVEFVGIGSDFDGGGGVLGLVDVTQIENLTVELLKLNYSEEDIEKIWGGNIMRVLKQARVPEDPLQADK